MINKDRDGNAPPIFLSIGTTMISVAHIVAKGVCSSKQGRTHRCYLVQPLRGVFWLNAARTWLTFSQDGPSISPLEDSQ